MPNPCLQFQINAIQIGIQLFQSMPIISTMPTWQEAQRRLRERSDHLGSAQLRQLDVEGTPRISLTTPLRLLGTWPMV
jgi:hypothetical protein